MSIYTPDNWVIIKITSKDKDPLYKVLGGWSGNYVEDDYWRINSGITRVKKINYYYEFLGASGSIYKCHVRNEMVMPNIASTLAGLLGLPAVELVKAEDINLGTTTDSSSNTK